jgi:CheY-like chemotaxis protein
MATKAEFRKLVKDALEHLYDTAYLATHPLLRQLTGIASANRLTRVQKLRSTLKETIESIRPQAALPARATEYRSYLALHYRFVQGMSMGQVENELGISLRQLQRELYKGLDAVTALLWEMRVSAPQHVMEQTMPESVETQVLYNEMAQWKLVREAADVYALFEEVVSMLKPTFSEQIPDLHMQFPDSLPPVFVDTTLIRQALFHLLRNLLQDNLGDEISLQAQIRDNQVEINIQGGKAVTDPSSSDLQIARLFIQRQGGTLATEISEDQRTTMVIKLPQANPPKVLVIDDNEAIHQLFERYLAPHFYELLHVYDGLTALQMAAEVRPDIIILDVMMPAVDGWQVLRNLVENPVTMRIPIIICSVLKEAELAFSLGARAYIKKPVDRMELVATLAQLQETVAPGEADQPSNPSDS